MTFNDMVAQLAHVAWGALLFDTLGARMKLRYAAAIVGAFFIGKEVIESVWGVWEPVQPWSSGLQDMAFWALGAYALGYILLKFWDRK